MRKVSGNINNLAIILSGIALFFGVVAIFTSRPYNYDLDIVGFIVAVLVCIITILIGWNIYAVIDTKDKLQNASEIEDRINEVIKKNELKWQYDLTLCSRLFTMDSTTMLQDRIAINFIVFHLSRDGSLFSKCLTRENILNLIENSFVGDNSLFNKLALEVSKNVEITNDVVSTFYKDFSSMNSIDKAKYKHVELFLSHLILIISKNNNV